MVDKDIDLALEKAVAFFNRAQQVAATDNFDYAIEMFLEGIKRFPDALEDGHLALRRMALVRQAKGGKKPGVVDKLKKRGGKTPLDDMLDAEYLFAKDPDNFGYAKDVMQAAVKGGFTRTAQWITDLVFSAIKAQDKPAVADVMLVRDCFVKLEAFDSAVAAAILALKLRPEDAQIQDSVKNLSAQATMVKGKFDQKGDFRKAILDREAQEKVYAQEAAVKAGDYRMIAVEQARKDLQREPESFMNRIKLAKTLIDLETQEGFDESYNLLEGYYQATGDFGYKRHQGDLKIKFLRRQLAVLRKKHELEPQNQQIKDAFADLVAKISDFELEYYKLCVENNPADLNFKYEYGLRLMFKKRYEDAIPFFQDARRDLRLRIQAMDKLGICFFNKGWFTDAIEIFEQAAEIHTASDDELAKEIRYNLARAYEQDNNLQKSLDIYRKLAQIDYNYKDVRQRVDALRARVGQ